MVRGAMVDARTRLGVKGVLSALALTMTACLSASTRLAGGCGCVPVGPQTSTVWGGNEQIIVTTDRVYRAIQGTATDLHGKPVPGALVEVFTDPAYLLHETVTAKHGHPRQRRVAACRTGANGRFCFRPALPGDFELRLSHADQRAGWNVIQCHIAFDPHDLAASDDDIEVRMTVGT